MFLTTFLGCQLKCPVGTFIVFTGAECTEMVCALGNCRYYRKRKQIYISSNIVCILKKKKQSQ